MRIKGWKTQEEFPQELGLDASQHNEKYLQGTLLMNEGKNETMVNVWEPDLAIKVLFVDADFFPQRLWKNTDCTEGHKAHFMLPKKTFATLKYQPTLI